MTRYQLSVLSLLSALVPAVSSGCTVTHKVIDPGNELAEARVKPGITVLLTDSIEAIRGKRVGILTNQTGINEKRESDIQLLRKDPRAVRAGVKLVAIFAPEHGITGAFDRENLPSGIDAESGIPVYSLYINGTQPPPDSAMQRLDVLVFDLQDIGTRTWTYVGAMVYAMRAAARNNKPMLVLDRPNPVSGYLVEGPLLDSAIANPNDPAPGRPGLAFGLYPIPLRHGMTMGELALFYKDVLNIPVRLSVIPMKNWTRDLWFDRTDLPWVKPSPNMPSLQSAMMYTGIVPFEATNLSVGRGTPEAFQRVGAPWLKPEAVIALLKDRELKGVRFAAEYFTPVNPTDGKHPNKRIPGIRMTVTNRSSMQAVRVGATLLWAIAKVHGDQLQVKPREFDRLLGSPSLRLALLRGEDPDRLIDREYQAAYQFRERTRRYLLYK